MERRLPRSLFVAAAFIALLSLSSSRNVSAYAYTFTEIVPTAGGDVFPRCINNNGVVVGNYRTSTNKIHAFKWSAGVFTDLGTMGSGDMSDAYCVNDAGVVGGAATASTTDLTYHPFIIPVGGSMTDLTPSAPNTGSVSGLFALNDAGVGTGTMFYLGSGGYKYRVPFIYQSGTLTNIAINGYNTSEWPAGINNWNQIAGSDNGWGSYIYSNGVRTNIPHIFTGSTDPGGMSTPAGINDTGQIVGMSMVNGANPQHAFLWNPTPKHNSVTGKVYDLGTLGGSASGVDAINSTGAIVGWSQITVGSGAGHGFICYAADVLRGAPNLTDLATIMDPTLVKVFDQPNSINDTGQIVGQYYDHTTSSYHGCLLTPQ